MLHQSRGFTLLEALIAVVVIAVGLLAVGRFQAGLVSSSGSSKARAEAIALAQQKIDDIRNYSSEPELVAKLLNITEDATDTFSTDILGMSGGTATVSESGTIAGVNADFTRGWVLTAAAGASTVVADVSVSWTDPKTGATDSVTLSTNIIYRDPEETAALAIDSDAVEGYPTSSGRAKEGSGKYGSIPAGAEQNKDGTYTYQNLAKGQVELIDANGYILLRLEDACDADGNCLDFVQISGYVWFEETDADIAIDNVFVANTPGAACVENKNAVIDTGDFNYFPYTCYAGGAWFGNISILHEETNDNKRADVCVGDPTTISGQGIDKPLYSGRRSYRGLMSQDVYVGDGTTITSPAATAGSDLVVDDENDDGIGNYRTVGVRDELVLPNPNDSNINSHYLQGYYIQADASQNLYLPGHNFLVLDLGNDDDDAGCVTAMNDSELTITLENSSGTTTVHAFTNTPDEFSCLNYVLSYTADTSGNTVTDASGTAITALQPYFDVEDERLEYGYLEPDRDQVSFYVATLDASDNTDTAYAVQSTQSADASGNPDDGNNIISTNSKYFMDTVGCRFNPSNVPEFVNTISGTIISTNSPAQRITGLVINTADDPYFGTSGNCTVTERGTIGGGGEVADYSCIIYHTYDVADSTGAGWDGNVVIAPSNNYSCTPSYHDFTGQSADSSGNDFSCVYSGVSGTDFVTTVALTSGDSTPPVAATVTFQVSVRNDGPENATNVSLTDSLDTGLTRTSSVPGAGSGTYSSGTWTIGSLASGATATMVVSAVVDASTGYQTLAYSVNAPTGDQVDPSSSGNVLSDSITVNDVTQADLITVKSLGGTMDTTPEPGDIVTYNITVTNKAGGGNVANVTLTESYPSQLSLVTANPGTDSASTANTYASNIWTIPLLNSGDSATLTLSGTVNNGTQGSTVTNSVTAASSISLPDPGTVGDDLTEIVSIPSANNADLVTTITVSDATPFNGDTITYTVNVLNNGPQNTSTSSVTTTVDLNTVTPVAGLALTGSSATAGTFNSFTGVWNGFDLVVNASANLTLTVGVNSDANTETQPIVVNTTYATSNRSDPIPSGDGDVSVDITASAVPVTTVDVTVIGDILYDSSKAVNSVSVQAVDNSGAPTGSAVSCSVSGSPKRDEYECTITLNNTQHSGIVLTQTTSGHTSCYNAKLSSGTLVTESTASNADYMWATWNGSSNIISQNLGLGANDGKCASLSGL